MIWYRRALVKLEEPPMAITHSSTERTLVIGSSKAILADWKCFESHSIGRGGT